jgi:AcrR family transcriptional regulator/DNA-binding MarR family transcriptional regulator
VASRAGVEERVFFEVFGDGQECLQAAFDEGLERLSRTVDEAAGREGCWLDRLRAGLVAFLGFLDDEPSWGRLLILDRLFTDGMIGSRRQWRVLGVLTSLLDSGAPRAAGDPLPDPMLTSEFVVGGVMSVIRARMLKADGAALVGLAPSLMSFMIRPFLGPVAANTELEGRSSVNDHATGSTRVPSREAELARAVSLPIRVTHRTTMVLRAIAQAPYSNNREIADAAELTDEGQTSKLLARLERHGIIENVGIGAARGEPNAWLLTPSGRRALALIAAGAVPRPRRTRVRSEA